MLALFRQVCLNDWFSDEDTAWYLDTALHAESAWSQGQCVGLAVLTGDGRISLSLDLLAVAPDWRGRGVGSELMRRVSEQIEQRQPYHVSIEVFCPRAQKLYERFGFVVNDGTWLMEHQPTADRLRRLANDARQQRDR